MWDSGAVSAPLKRWGSLGLGLGCRTWATWGGGVCGPGAPPAPNPEPSPAPRREPEGKRRPQFPGHPPERAGSH